MEQIRAWLEQFKDKPLKDKVLLVVPYILCMFCIARIAELYRLCHGDFFMFLKNIQYIYKAFPPRFHLGDLLIGLSVGFFIAYAARWRSKMHTKNTRFGAEYGSAKWGTEQDIKPFIDKDPFNNLILSQTEMLSMNPQMSAFKLNRNKHVIVTGSSGAGKTFRIVKPNLCQTYGSYVLTDPNR